MLKHSWNGCWSKQSMQSESCKSTELKRSIVTEIRSNINLASLCDGHRKGCTVTQITDELHC